MLWAENLASDHKLLFSWCQGEIAGEIDVTIGRTNNDFGCGFYTGESYDQSISFISNFNKSCVYFLDFNNVDLRCKKYNVDQEWIMTIAYYRNALSKYAEHPIVQKLVAQSTDITHTHMNLVLFRYTKLIKPKELRELFLAYHTLDPSQAIERILEAKNILYDDEGELQRTIYNI